MLFSLLKHYLELYITDTALKVSRSCTVSLLLYVMVLRTVSPGCGVRASLMLFFISRRALAREGDYEMMSVCACVYECMRACVR